MYIDLRDHRRFLHFTVYYPREAMLARVFATATCPSVRLSQAGIVSKWRKLPSWFLHYHDSSFLLPNFITKF